MSQLRDNADAYRSRAMSTRRKIFVACFVLVLLPVLAVTFVILRFDPNRYAPAIVAAVDQATGRQLALSGPVTMSLSLSPQINLNGVRLSNPPGFPDPNLLTMDRVTAQIALLPLLSHHLDILQLSLVHPTVWLERNAAGQADWDFSQGSPPNATPSPAPPAPASGNGYSLALQAVTVDQALLVFGASPQAPLKLAVTSLTGTADSVAAPLHLDAQAELGSMPLTISGVLGPVARFSGLGTGPWPVALNLQLADATASVNGAVDQPRTGRGYNLALAANIPALEHLAQAVPPELLHGWTIPALRNLQLGLKIVDQGSAMPAIENLSLSAGASDLSALRPGATLTAAEIAMPSLAAPVTFNLAGKAGASPFTLSGTTGAVAALLNPALLPPAVAPANFPVSVNAQFGAARIAVNGAISTPQTLSGVALGVNASIPELSALGVAAGQSLPDWKNIALQATIIDPGGQGLRQAVGIDGLAVTMDNAGFGGDASLYLGAQPRLQLALKFSQFNLDALLAAVPAAPASASPEPPPASASAPGAVIPDVALPIRALKTASADVQISADTLIWRHASFTAIQAHAALANGVLTLDPVTGQVPGGSVTASATVDSTKNPAAETLNLSAPALALSPFLGAFGLSNTAEGTVQAKIAATSTGNDLPAMASGLDGQFGLAMVNGTVDGSVMDRLFGSVLGTVGLPERIVGAQGPVAVRCMGFRLDAQNGTGTIRALTLDSSRLLVQGGGSVDFGNETLDIILRPQLDLAGTELGVPVLVGGSFAAPTTAVAPASAVAAAAKAAIGLPVNIAQEAFGANTIFGTAASLLGAGPAQDVCPAALALGRLGQPGPAAPPPAAGPSPLLNPAKLRGPRNLLDALFGK